MKTKYEQFYEQIIHSLDEPKKYYPLHKKIGINKSEDLRKLKFHMMSATKIFLSDDFIYKDYYKEKEKKNKLIGNYFDHKKGKRIVDKEKFEKTQTELRKEVERRKEMGYGIDFTNALPIYDNCVIIFPREDLWVTYGGYKTSRFEFMNMLWITKLNKRDRLQIYNHDKDRCSESIVGNNNIYNVVAFDNFEFIGRQVVQELINKNIINDQESIDDFRKRTDSYLPWIRSDLFPYVVDFEGNGIFPSSQIDSFKHIFPLHPLEYRKELEKFIKFSNSPICSDRGLSDEFMIDYLEENKYESYVPFMRLGNIIALLAFINEKGQETQKFVSSIPVKKRSNVQKQFEYKMLEVHRKNRITTRFGESINKNRLHSVRGHLREYQSGKKIWIKPYKRGDEKLGIIIKDYDFK